MWVGGSIAFLVPAGNDPRGPAASSGAERTVIRKENVTSGYHFRVRGPVLGMGVHRPRARALSLTPAKVNKAAIGVCREQDAIIVCRPPGTAHGKRNRRTPGSSIRQPRRKLPWRKHCIFGCVQGYSACAFGLSCSCPLIALLHCLALGSCRQVTPYPAALDLVAGKSLSILQCLTCLQAPRPSSRDLAAAILYESQRTILVI